MAQVALIIFNRPDLVETQVGLLRQLPLERLFVIADGPREGTDDAGKCAASRAIVENAAWSCPVETSFADRNMGCANRIVTGLDWVFSRTDRAIILEDDCVADQTFFAFCDELLERYSQQSEVMHICGTNLLAGSRLPYSYRFSHHVVCWGWATWARAWAKNDLAMRVDDDRLEMLLHRHLFGNSRAIDHWRNEIKLTRLGKLDAWDYPWQVSVWDNDGTAIHPACNLVTNIGFRADGTHTRNANSPLANLSTRPIDLPLSHPPEQDAGYELDRLFVNQVFGNRTQKPTLARRILRKAKRLLTGG